MSKVRPTQKCANLVDLKQNFAKSVLFGKGLLRYSRERAIQSLFVSTEFEESETFQGRGHTEVLFAMVDTDGSGSVDCIELASMQDSLPFGQHLNFDRLNKADDHSVTIIEWRQVRAQLMEIHFVPAVDELNEFII